MFRRTEITMFKSL